MSRAVLDLPTYRSAADQLLQANHVLASAHTALARELAGSGAMAGDDATSQEFADTYDDAAAGAVAAHADLVESLTTLGRLLARSADNHHRADTASVLGATTPFDPLDPPALLDGPVSVEATAPPSCLGGDAGDRPDLWDLVAGHLEGWTWPGADTDRLRTTAAAWRRAAATTRVVPTYCDAAIGALADQYSPEIPLAVEAVDDLAVTADLLARSLDDLATACEAYADQVEHHRALVTGILTDLALEIAATIAAAAVLSAVSGGTAAAGGAGMISARVTTAARRIAGHLADLKRLAALKAVGTLTSAVLRLGPVRTTVSKFAAARHLDEAAVVRRVDDAAELDTIVYGKAGGRLDLDEVPAWVGLRPKVRVRWNVLIKFKGQGRLTPLEHIKRGHWPGTTVPNKGRFRDDMSEEQLWEYVEEAVRRGDVGPRGRVTHEFDHVIGTNRQGHPSRRIEMYIHDGVLHTAYPS